MNIEAGDGLVSFPKGSRLHQLFFGTRLPSRTDGPRYWTHPNTAYRLGAVWIQDQGLQQDLMTRLGAKRLLTRACSPFPKGASIYEFQGGGDRVLLTPRSGPSDARAILAMTVLVRSLASAQQVLTANHVPLIQPGRCATPSLWVRPSIAHGIWLEFKQGNAAGE